MDCQPTGYSVVIACPNLRVVGETTGPDPVQWCSVCGALINGDEFEFPEQNTYPMCNYLMSEPAKYIGD